VTVATLADPPTVSPGDTFQLVVRVRIASGYHIYSTKASEGSFSPTSLTFILPDELAFAGDWVFPPPIITQTGESVYRDSVLFRRQVKVQLNAVPKQLSIKGELLCQACNPDLCFPARKLPISASVAVVSKTKK
jgi:DsbC/DsbD-like thiol-disulfide interchange protein